MSKQVGKTKEDYPLVLTREDVEEIMICKKDTARKYINAVNKRLEEDGKIISPEICNLSRVPRDVFLK